MLYHWDWCYCLLYIHLMIWLMLLPLLWQMLLPLCFCIVLADVIANCVWQMLLPLRLMLLPTIIVFGWCYCQNSGRSYNHYIKCVGWWYCQVADGMATVGWRMVSGWCYYHWVDVIALGQCLKEALYSRVNNPSLNRYVGKYHLQHIWDEVLYNIPELKLK